MGGTDMSFVIEKIISGGQTGADQAALDIAIEMGIPHGGWVPKGRKTEEGALPDKYQLEELATEAYEDRTEKNVLESDGTLILSHGELTGGSALTKRLAKQHNRPWKHVDLNEMSSFAAAMKIIAWVTENKIQVLNVAGPPASKDPEIYEATKRILKAVYFMSVIKAKKIDLEHIPYAKATTVSEAVKMLEAELSMKDKSLIARMEEGELFRLHPSLGTYIHTHFGLWARNSKLIKSCQFMLKKQDIREDDAMALIIKELWKRLKETHTLRVVK
jgi:hypothetical protein